MFTVLCVSGGGGVGDVMEMAGSALLVSFATFLTRIVVEIESVSLDYSCDQDKKENGISGCLCEVQRQTDG